MRNAAMACFILISVMPLAGRSTVYTVDCTGGGDFTDLPHACYAAGGGDTVLVMPCTYDATSYWWPIRLDGDSPVIVGVGGADSTILQGGGSSCAFYTEDGSGWARVLISGLTIRDFYEPIDHNATGLVLRFTDNIVESCAQGLATHGTGPSGVVSGNVFRDIGGGALYTYHNSGLIACNEIYDSRYGICGTCCEEPLIQGNHIHHNELYGIRASFYYDVQGNILEHNGGAGLKVSHSGVYSGNIIRGNGVGIENSGSVGSFWSNDIYDNLEFNVLVHPQFTHVIDMTMNWWGTTDPIAIAESIYDCEDDPSIGLCVEFEPFCVSPGCGATPVEAVSWGAIKALYR